MGRLRAGNRGFQIDKRHKTPFKLEGARAKEPELSEVRLERIARVLMHGFLNAVGGRNRIELPVGLHVTTTVPDFARHLESATRALGF